MQEATYVFRPAANGSESERAAHYFLEQPPGEVRWFVAVRRRPVERVVGSVGWWLKLDAGGYARAEFDWYLEESLRGEPVAVEMLQAVVCHIRRTTSAPIESVGRFRPLSAEAAALEVAGFKRGEPKQLYQMSVKKARERVRRVGERLWGRLAGRHCTPFAIEPFRVGHVEQVWELLQDRCGLDHFGFMRALHQRAFTDFSMVIKAEDRIRGVLLCQRRPKGVVEVAGYVIDALPGRFPTGRAAALLLHACATRPGWERVDWLQVRLDGEPGGVEIPAIQRLAGKWLGECRQYEWEGPERPIPIETGYVPAEFERSPFAGALG